MVMAIVDFGLVGLNAVEIGSSQMDLMIASCSNRSFSADSLHLGSIGSLNIVCLVLSV